LRELGYPGLENPRILIRSALNPEAVMGSSGGARVHYQVGEAGDVTLPEKYNGLGFKNLIYMVVELLDLHATWLTDEEQDGVPLHLVFIEEPEAHLHVQLQQVFIRKVLDILAVEGGKADGWSSQVVVTTHSPHILYERGFRPIRYFRRLTTTPMGPASEVLNVSRFCETNAEDRDFLERYMRLAHCDLFFADAAILVEGNVERLLMPLMIEKAASVLRGAYLSILEVGGAFGYRFRKLIEFLGLTTLIVTDIDSVHGVAGEGPDDGDTEAGEGETSGRRRACSVDTPGAMTSNQTLIQWLPRKSFITELLAVSSAEKTTSEGPGMTRVAYQMEHDVSWACTSGGYTGRTFEEAFALQNMEWCQDENRQALGLRIRNASTLALGDLAEKLYQRVKSSAFKKTDFALAVLAQDPAGWVVPTYVADGLQWLAAQLVPVDNDQTAASAGHVDGEQV
jgi:predicted ATP-dependent endonuclease of OLD family